MVSYFDAPLTTGQTAITLPFTYTLGANQLLVFYNGELLTAIDDYLETSPTSITLLAAVLASDRLIVRRFGESSLELDDLGDVNAPSPSDCYVLTWNQASLQWIAAPPNAGLITSANIINGRISVSFAAMCKKSGILDLTFDVRNPSNTQVAASIPLTEYFTTGIYYGSVDVGISTPGPHLVRVASVSRPDNHDEKIFNVSPLQAQRGGGVIQEATRKFGDTFTFRHIADPSLTDVTLTIYNASDVPVLTSQPMIEIGTTGVFKYAFNPGSAGLYTGIMGSPTIDSKSVTEIIFVTQTGTGGTSTIISNRVGVGRREDC